MSGFAKGLLGLVTTLGAVLTVFVSMAAGIWAATWLNTGVHAIASGAPGWLVGPVLILVFFAVSGVGLSLANRFELDAV